MNALLIPYPEIDPVLVQLGPFAIRWYALAYIAGLVIGWQIMRRVCEQPPKLLSPVKIDDFLLWAALGVILGGRLGYVLFYKPGFYLSNPLAILTLWEGGMSFHGGLLGVVVAILAFAWRNKVDPLRLSDLVAIVTPIGLFFGRLANFINGELWGRITDVPWAMIFPRGGPLPRHPSQLYQAFFRGRAGHPGAAGRVAPQRRPPPPGPADRRVLRGLWRGPHRGRAVSRARRASRLSRGTVAHHGHAAVAAVAGLWRLADRPGISAPRCFVTPVP